MSLTIKWLADGRKTETCGWRITHVACWETVAAFQEMTHKVGKLFTIRPIAFQRDDRTLAFQSQAVQVQFDRCCYWYSACFPLLI